MRETSNGRVPSNLPVYLLNVVAYETPAPNDLSNLSGKHP